VAVFGATFSVNGHKALVWGYDDARAETRSLSIRDWDIRGTDSIHDFWENLFWKNERICLNHDPEQQIHFAGFTATDKERALVGFKIDPQHYSLHAVDVYRSADTPEFLIINDPQVVGVFSPNGLRLLLSCVSDDPCGTDRNTLRLWNLETNQDYPHRFIGHTKVINAVAFSPSGCRAISGSDDTTVRLWSVKTGTKLPLLPLGEAHTGPVTCVAISQDGRQAVSGSQDCTVRLWKLPDEAHE
jgi:WD40 repeat protein